MGVFVYKYDIEIQNFQLRLGLHKSFFAKCSNFEIYLAKLLWLIRF